MNFDWTRISDDPNNSQAKAAERALLPTLRRIHTDTDLIGFVERAAAGRRVLDIGMAAHSLRHVDDPNWRHGKIARAAARHLVKPIDGWSLRLKFLVWHLGLMPPEYSFPDYLFELAPIEA